MQLHELKIWPEYFYDLRDGKKTFEIRKDDRGYKDGDVITLREWDPVIENFTGQKLLLGVIKVFKDLPGLDPEYCIMSVRVYR